MGSLTRKSLILLQLHGRLILLIDLVATSIPPLCGLLLLLLLLLRLLLYIRIAYHCHVTPRGISNYEIHLAIASCTHCHDQPSACTALPSWRCSITSARLAVRDIEVRRNSGLSGKARSTLHALHAPLVRCACPFIEATHIEHYRNILFVLTLISHLPS